MRKTPKVSVLVPVYNVETYIEKCIESIRNQTFKDYELILCDDGSTDSSGSICDRFAEMDERIRVIHKENEGLLWTRRRMFHEAKGEYFICIDSDDWVSTELLQKTVEYAEKNNSDVVAYGYARTTDAGEVTSIHADLYPDNTVFSGEKLQKIYTDFALGNQLNFLCFKLISAKLISREEEKDPLYRKHILGEDKLQMIPVFERAKCICYCAEPLYYYRSSVSGMCRNHKLSYFNDVIEVHKRVLGFLHKKGVDTEENLKLFYYGYCRSMTKNIEMAVHSLLYNNRELKDTFNEIRETEMYRNATTYVQKLEGSVLDRIVYYLYKKKWYGMLIHFLKVEQQVVKMYRKTK